LPFLFAGGHKQYLFPIDRDGIVGPQIFEQDADSKRVLVAHSFTRLLANHANRLHSGELRILDSYVLSNQPVRWNRLMTNPMCAVLLWLFSGNIWLFPRTTAVVSHGIHVEASPLYCAEFSTESQHLWAYSIRMHMPRSQVDTQQQDQSRDAECHCGDGNDAVCTRSQLVSRYWEIFDGESIERVCCVLQRRWRTADLRASVLSVVVHVLIVLLCSG
jgi:uncharacterized protein affecting Mg2+/Co2+ transport